MGAIMKVSKSIGWCLVTTCVSAVLIASEPASAQQYIAEYQGTVQNGTDALGIFGAAGADLTGLDFDAQFIFDPSTATTTYDDGVQAYFRNALETAILTINGHSYTWGPNNDGFVDVLNNLPSSPLYSEDEDLRQDQADDNNGRIYLSIYSGQHSLFTTDDYTAPFDHSVDASTEYAGGAFNLGGFYNGPTSGNLLATQVTVSAYVPSVPEPSTWALMLFGFGAIGAAMRRIRKTDRLPQLA